MAAFFRSRQIMSEQNPLNPPTTVRPGDRQTWGQLHGAAQALALANAARSHEGLSLVIAPDTSTAQRLESELRYFAGDQLPVLHLADWETLPY
ncbi:hypothetical protein, partial [Marinimicrobium sp. UBA4209]